MAFEAFDGDRFDYLFLENIGNLVCPADFDTGAHTRVMLLSVPEGWDKVMKYPPMFAAVDALIVTKCDYLPLNEDFDMDRLKEQARLLNPALDIEGFLLTMYMRNRLNNQVVTEVREHFGELAYDTIIQRNIRLGEAPSHGKPVMLYDAGAVGSENYLNLAREFLKRNRKSRSK